ncbi:MAG: sugar phosphate isomerase/epimerase [SAR202 cluster bacterium]|nr:sugar phosphate isomerase/epimerase [SAR202 cluster bacterium]
MAIKIGMLCDFFKPGEKPKAVDIFECLELAKDLKVDTVDMDFKRGFTSTDPAYLMSVKRQAIRYGLPIGYVCSALIMGGTDEEAAPRVAQAKKDVDMAVFMGASMTHVYAYGGHQPDGTPEYEKGWAAIARRCREIADYANERGISVGVQNHNSGSWLADEKTVVRLMNDVGRDNFFLHLDTGQWKDSITTQPRGVVKNQADPMVHETYIAKTLKYARHTRAKMYNLASGTEKYIDYRNVARILRAQNFNGVMTIVLDNETIDTISDIDMVRRAVPYLRGCFRQ